MRNIYDVDLECLLPGIYTDVRKKVFFESYTFLTPYSILPTFVCMGTIINYQ